MVLLPDSLFLSLRFHSVTIDLTQYHRESGLFVCVSVLLEWAHREKITPHLTVYPLLAPSSSSGLDLHVALTVKLTAHIQKTQQNHLCLRYFNNPNHVTFLQVLLLLSALLIFFTELWPKAIEHSQSHHQLRHWFQLFLASLSLVTAMLQFCFLSAASSCVNQVLHSIFESSVLKNH